MSALFNFDHNKLERIEDNVFAIGSVIGQIFLPIGMIMLLTFPSMAETLFKTDMSLSIAYPIFSLMGVLLGFGATASAGLDSNTIWHRLNRKLKVFGYKWITKKF